MGGEVSAMISQADLAKHNTVEDSWISIDGQCYDITNFLARHPGGSKVLQNEAGKDASRAYYTMHDAATLQTALEQGLVVHMGELSTETVSASTTERPPSLVPYQDDPAYGMPEHDADLEHFKSIQSPGVVQNLFSSVLGVSNYATQAASDVLRHTLNGVVFPTIKAVAPVRGFPLAADGKKTKVAVIGGGCSGLSAAFSLTHTEGYEVTVFEKGQLLGGHSNTFEYDPHVHGGGPPGQPKIMVDMGFIFGNYQSYQNMLELMALTGTEAVESELSLSVDIDGCKWSTDTHLCPIDGVRDDGHMHPDGLAECTRFHDLAEQLYDNRGLNQFPFGAFLALHGFAEDWKKLYMTPTLITLFISPDGLYPMSTRFMLNMFAGPNKYVDLRMAWRVFTVKGGTYQWIKNLAASFKDHCRTNCAVKRIRKASAATNNMAIVELESGEVLEYDHIVMSLGAPAARLLLEPEDMSWTDRQLFDGITYATERIVLHTDQSFVPQDPKMKRNFNYVHYEGMPNPQLTGLMHEVLPQGQSNPNPVLTLNPGREIPQDKIVCEKYCAVHVQDLKHLILCRTVLPMMQGVGGIWYAGSWANYFGHSGGIDAGLAVAARLGGRYPLKGDICREGLFHDACFDMFGPAFDWETPVREKLPIGVPLRAKL